jgi:hypothetical protein
MVRCAEAFVRCVVSPLVSILVEMRGSPLREYIIRDMVMGIDETREDISAAQIQSDRPRRTITIDGDARNRIARYRKLTFENPVRSD